jgi:hypothetical protein
MEETGCGRTESAIQVHAWLVCEKPRKPKSEWSVRAKLWSRTWNRSATRLATTFRNVAHVNIAAKRRGKNKCDPKTRCRTEGNGDNSPKVLITRATADNNTASYAYRHTKRLWLLSKLMQCISYPVKLKCQIAKRRARQFVDVLTNRNKHNTWNDSPLKSSYSKKRNSAT